MTLKENLKLLVRVPNFVNETLFFNLPNFKDSKNGTNTVEGTEPTFSQLKNVFLNRSSIV